MDLRKFNSLSEKQKAYAVWDGTFILLRRDDDIMVKLYSVGSFFVEEFYCSQEKIILGFNACAAKNLPDVYLENLKLKAAY